MKRNWRLFLRHPLFAVLMLQMSPLGWIWAGIVYGTAAYFAFLYDLADNNGGWNGTGAGGSF